MDVTTGVKEVLSDTLDLGDRVDEFNANTPLFESLIELDSMAIVNVLVALEDKFEIEIDDDEIGADTFDTFGTLTEFVGSKVA